MKNAITEIKNTLEGINSRLDDTKERISEQEGRIVEITEAEQKKENTKRNLKHHEKLKLLHALPVPRGTQSSVKLNVNSFTRKSKCGNLWSSFTKHKT